jgi:hypothetical protein
VISAMTRRYVSLTNIRFTAVALCVLLFAGVTGCRQAAAQSQAECGADGYRVTARRWDAVLGMVWELRQNCSHSDWPARLVAVGPGSIRPAERADLASPIAAAAIILPLLVHAGEQVRLWSQDESVRIEMSGEAERSARGGERVMVRVTRQSEDAGLTVQEIAGTVRGPGDVEMER